MQRHRCNYLNCRTLVPMDTKFCPIHTQQNKSDRDKYLTNYQQGIKGSLKEQHDNKQAQQRYDNTTRDTQATEFYHSTRWTKTANNVRVRDSYMSAISGKILNRNDTQVDHVIKRELLPREQWYNSNNLWLLSRKEHQLKSAIESKMMRDNKQIVLKHLTKEWWTKVLRERLYN